MKKLARLLLNDYVILWLIVINSVVIFVQGFELPGPVMEKLMVIDHLITIVFVLELLTKVVKYGPSRFVRSGWNLFDGTLIILALPSLFLWAFHIHDSNLDYLLILRIARVFKFFRFVRFFPNIDQLFNGIQRALKASVIVILGFFVYNFIVSVLSCFFYREISPEYFGNPFTSLYTTFKIFTIEGWNEIPESIAENSSHAVAFMTKIYFAIILLTGGIFGLSLVNSIFVDAMVSDNNDELEKKVDSLEKKIDRLLENAKYKDPV